MENKLYCEEEKKYHIAKAVYENNHKIFKMIESDIDSLITRRLIDFRKGIPAISEPSNHPIVDCKE